jgi:hypothetical protein
MARIRAGNTLANQYAPPFVVSDSVSTNWHLRWSDNLKAFEAYDPDENANINAGFDSIEVYGPLVGTGGQSFILPWAVATKQSLIITINGVKQDQAAYSLGTVTDSTTQVIMASAVNSPDEIEFVGLQASNPTDIKVYTAVGDNSQMTWTLPWVTPSAAALIVTLDGVKQSVNSYIITPVGLATDITFTGTPGLGVAIEVVGIIDTGETPASPVNMINLYTGPGSASVYKEKVTSGATQIFNMRSLSEGTGVTLTEGPTSITISAASKTFSNLGSGRTLMVDPNADPIEFYAVTGSGRIEISNPALTGDTLTFSYNHGYKQDGAATVNASPTDRVVGVTNAGSAVTVNLAAIGNMTAGDSITVKDEAGDANTFNITIETAGAETIDGAANYTINTAYGYVTLYSDGANYFVIAAG